MAIRFRCEACSGLMAITSRKAGLTVVCPLCHQHTKVPLTDIYEAAAAVAEQPSPTPNPQNDVDDSTFAPPNESEVASKHQAQHRSPARPDVDQIESTVDSESESQKNSTRHEESSASEDEPSAPLKLRRHQGGDDEMDLTPMVDVTFQLLIFFMVTASFALQKSIEAPTPDQEKKGAAQTMQILEEIEVTSIQVQIDAKNAITIDEDPVADPSRLPDLLRDKMRKEQKSEILISANALALHRTVVAVIDAAQEVGMQKIRMASRAGKSE